MRCAIDSQPWILAAMIQRDQCRAVISRPIKARIIQAVR